MGIKFNSSGKIDGNNPPEKVAAADILVDGVEKNKDVLVGDRYPVFSWEYNDGDNDAQKAVEIWLSTDNVTEFADFVESVDEDKTRVSYPASQPALLGETTYYMKLRVMDASGAYSQWSDTAAFYTVSSEISIDKSKIDLKIDWNNPFYEGEYTKIRYSLPAGIDQEVFLAVYSTGGRLVKVLVDDESKIADVVHTEYWDGTDESGSTVGSGIYIVHLRVGDTYKTEKVCFVR